MSSAPPILPPREPREPPATFDEQLWPVNVALLILAGFVAGAIIAKSAFVDEPRMLYNGWVRLVSLAVTTGLLMWLASRITSTRFQRALQLAALVSIIFHVLFIAGLYRQSDRPLRNLFEPNVPVAENAPPERPDVVLPEYQLEGPGEQPREEAISQPVEALARLERPQKSEKAPPRPPAPLPPAPLKPQQEPPPAAKVEVRPNNVKMAERQEAAPRRGAPSKLSKRAAEPRLNPENPAPATPDTKLGEQPPAKVVPQVSDSRRQADLPAAAAAKAEPSPAAPPRQQSALQLARRERPDSAERELPSRPTAPKALNKPAAVPRSNDAAADVGVSAAPIAAVKPSPQVAAPRQPAGAAANDGGLVANNEPRGDVKLPGPQATPRDAPRHDRRDEPRLASTAGAAPRRSARERSVPAGGEDFPLGTAADPALAGSAGRGASAAPDKAPAGSPSLAPSTSIERHAQTAGFSPGPLAAENPSESSAAPRVVGGSKLQRAELGPVATLDPTARAAGPPARATRAAQVEASPIPVDNPVAGQPDLAKAEPDSQPGRTALARGSGGVFGLGQGPNLDSGAAAADKPAAVASVSAQRPHALQADGSGPALTPSAPALVPRSTAGARVPQATLTATDAPLPTEAGAAPGHVGPANIGASAALQRADSGAAKGPISAGAGPGQIDIGPTQVVAATSRVGNALGAGGGGAPSVPVASAAGLASRGGARGAAAASLATANVADLPEAPPGEGGGTPGGSPTAEGMLPAATRAGGGGSLPLAAMSIEGGLGAGGTGTGAGGPGGGGLGPPGGTGSGAGAGNGLGEGAAGPGSGKAGAGSATGSGVARLGLARSSAAQPDSAGPVVGTGGIGLGAAGNGTGSVGGRQPRGAGTGLMADTAADVPDALAGGPAGGAGGPGTGAGGNGKSPAGTPGAAGGGDALGPSGASVGVERRAGGLPGQALGGPVGTAAGDALIDSPLVSGPGNGLNPRAGAAGDPGAPQVASVPMSGAVRGANVAGSAAAKAVQGAAEMIEDPVSPGHELGAGGGSAPQPGELALTARAGSPTRRPGSLPIDAAGPEGSGGLGTDFSPQVGSPLRHAARDSEVVNAGAGRFLGRKAGGPVGVDARAREPARAFAGRGGMRSGLGDGALKPLERTEAAVELGLDFLARNQLADGRWSLLLGDRRGAESENPVFHADTAATGLALLSFLGAGYDHYDDQYQRVVQAGLQFLVQHQRPDGNLYLPGDAVSNKSAQFYSHGIATIALCEAYGMTGDETLRKAAQRAIDFIVASQHPKLGGWRYEPQFSADTSVSGWQLMALKSGELAGLKVPPEAYQLARHWLDQAQAGSDASQYAYNPHASESQKQGRKPTSTMTAVGLLMRLYLGWNRDDPRMQQGAQHLLENLPSLGTKAHSGRDTYYWYYATQVMFHMKGDYWRKWNERLHPLLIDQQVRTGPLAGSWDPLGTVPDRWGAQAGRIYVTTMNLLSLEVYYRHLPIYESEAR